MADTPPKESPPITVVLPDGQEVTGRLQDAPDHVKPVPGVSYDDVPTT
ncbi:hypothetical protein [Streptomyces agglomeratus]